MVTRSTYTDAVRSAIESSLRGCKPLPDDQSRPIIEDGAPLEHILPTLLVVRQQKSRRPVLTPQPSTDRDVSTPTKRRGAPVTVQTPSPSKGSGASPLKSHPLDFAADIQDDPSDSPSCSNNKPAPSRERCFIEPSTNSVRISFRLPQADALDDALVGLYMRLLMQRADQLGIIRRVPVPTYDLSFLITARHGAQLSQGSLVDIIAGFIEDSHRQVSDLKLAVNARGRAVATEVLGALAF